MAAKKRRTIVSLGMNLMEPDVMASINNFEGSEQHFSGVGKVRVERLLDFQVMSTKVVHEFALFFLVEYVVLEPLKESPDGELSE